MVEFKGFMARREYKMITKRLRQGKKIGARQGQWTNGTPPYPYLYQHYRDKYNEKGIVVHDERLKVYREMITMALDGIIPNKIAIHLNNKGIFTAKGNKWSGLAVQRILEDETHLGKIVSNKSQGDGHKNKRPNAKEAKRLPREQWVVVENCHEAVKTPEEHNKIIEMIKARTLIPNRGKKQTHVFTGLIKCAICGNAQTFYIRDDGVVCMKPCWYVDNHGKKCTNSGIKMNIVEEMVLEEIRKYKEYILSEAVLETSVKENKFQNQIDEKEDYLYKLKQALQKVNDAYEMGDYSREEWIERKKKRETEIYRVNNELYELKKKSKENEEITNAERLEKLENFFDNLLTYTDNAERNSLYKTIIDSIIWLRIGNTIDMKINFI